MAENWDVVLDAYAPRNREPYFYPAAIRLRGECRMGELTGKSPNGAMNMLRDKAIPGDRMLVDTKNRKVKIVDRMSLPENADIDRKLRELAGTESYLGGRYDAFKPDQDFNVGLKDWPTWLHHMRRLLDHGRLKLVKGRLPSHEEIFKLGPVRLGDNCNLPPLDKDKPFWRMDLEQYQEEQLEAATSA